MGSSGFCRKHEKTKDDLMSSAILQFAVNGFHNSAHQMFNRA